MTEKIFKSHSLCALVCVGISPIIGCSQVDDVPAQKPNVIMLMADDLGWGDVGFNGNTVIKTPSLDNLAKEGVILNRFYSAAPVSSPTRGSCVTGRNPYRYGIYHANTGRVKKEEVTIAEVLKENGYATGHFGKWHLGTLSDSLPDGRSGGANVKRFAPPWDNGFDECFSTEQAVPTWDPMDNQEIKTLTRYWSGYREYVTDNLSGDDSRVIVDRVLPFIKKSVDNSEPFLSVVWFHAPHTPVVAGESYKKLYSNESDDKQHYYGCITAMDVQVGRLVDYLKELGVADNTIIVFCSDNGPAGEGGGTAQYPGKRQQGVTGGFKGRKGSLHEGGIRVPALISWPASLPQGVESDVPMSTSDYFTSILSVLGLELPAREYDGINIIPLIQSDVEDRGEYIGFQSIVSVCMMSDQYKLIIDKKGVAEDELYDIKNDPFETDNIVDEKPEIAADLKVRALKFVESCKESDAGSEYLLN